MTTKKTVLLIVGIVGVLTLVVAVFVGVIVGVALYQLGNSQAAETAKDFLRQNEKLKAEIGQVEDFGSLVTGSISLQNGSGEGTLNLKVIGKNKTVRASVDLVLVRGGAWRVSAASYWDQEGNRVGLLDPYDTGLIIPLLIA